ncbi:hypothetical protein GCM10027157_15430 [Corynebacterium aquatimens]
MLDLKLNHEREPVTPTHNMPARFGDLGDWDASVELFPQDFTLFAMPRSARTLIDGSSAHVFTSPAELDAFLEAEDMRNAPARKKSVAKWVLLLAGVLLVATGVSFIAALFALSWQLLVLSLGTAFASFVAFFASAALGVKEGVDMITGHPQYRRLNRSFAQNHRALPVFFADTNTLSAEERDVLANCVGLYNYCAANDFGLTPQRWRALTLRALTDARTARDHNDPSALVPTRELIRQIEAGGV